MPFFTTSFFISDDVLVDLDVKRADGWTISFDKLVIAAKMGHFDGGDGGNA